MTPEDIGRRLEDAAQLAFPEGGAGDRAAAQRAEAAILGDLRPVNPMAPDWLHALILVLWFVAAAVDSASFLGMEGLRALGNGQAALIFAALLSAGWLGAVACARLMRPATGRNLGPTAWVLACSLVAVVFAILFHGYDTAHFVQDGIPCLRAGLFIATPTGLVIGLLLRRGLVLNWGAAGLAAGTVAGLAGLGMLELHCPNLKAVHVLVWHVAVVAVSGGLGFALGRMSGEFE